MPGSHAATTGELLFQQKGIPYKRIDLLPVISWGVLKALRFPEVTVPAAKIDGERVQGTRAIARALDARQPEPPLFPADAERRRAVEEAELNLHRHRHYRARQGKPQHERQAWLCRPSFLP